MEILSQALPIVIYILLIVLLVILITFGIKLLMTVSKLEKTVNEFTTKLESFNSLFTVADFIADKIARLGDLALDFISDKVRKVTKKRKGDEEDE